MGGGAAPAKAGEGGVASMRAEGMNPRRAAGGSLVDAVPWMRPTGGGAAHREEPT